MDVLDQILSNNKTQSSIQSEAEIRSNRDNLDFPQFEILPCSLLDSLPDEVYLKIMTTYGLSVQDIENVGKSGFDGRTEFAFEKLEHAIIKLYTKLGLHDFKKDNYELILIMTKLPKTLKSVKITKDIHVVTVVQW